MTNRQDSGNLQKRRSSGYVRDRKKLRGQVVVEYVIVLALSFVLALSLVYLMRAIIGHGDDTVEQIGYDVP